MNTDVIESVLQEILSDQKETLKLNKQLMSRIEYLSDKVENLETDGYNHQPIPSVGDTEVLKIIMEGIEDMKQVVAGGQKNVAHKQILILPEFKSPECYRLLFNCIIYITIATYSFLILRIVVDHWCR